MKVEIADADSDYPNVFESLQYFLMTYRNAIGDISAPGYSSWTENEVNKYTSNFAITLIWAIWFSNQFFNLIILLNFLIAVIS